MGKVTKKALEKHSVSLSPALDSFIQKACSVPLADLPSHLASLSTRWPFPRGDLYNWIEVLDRFDEVLLRFNELYKLSDGYQARPFGLLLLIEQSADTTEQHLREQGYSMDGDRELVEAILTFSKLLLEKCGNRALYNSTDRLNDLLNTTSLSLLHCTLRIAIFLAQRYAERSTNPPQPHASFFQFDNAKFDRLVSSFVSPHALSGKSGPASPVKTTKAKDKTAQSNKRRRSSTSVDPYDFRSMLKTTQSSGASGKQSGMMQDTDWQQWARVKIVWSTTPDDSSDRGEDNHDQTPDVPPTPTPVRRQSSALARPPITASSGETSSSAMAPAPLEIPGLRTIELTAVDLQKTTAEDILNKYTPEMSRPVRYELLHKLRVAYGLADSVDSRRLLVQVRLLGLAVFAFIYDEHEFSSKLFGSDLSQFTRQQLVHQIVSLLQENKKNQENVTMYLQTLAMESLAVLARQRMLSGEVMSALAPNSGHGLLLALTQRGLADMAQDGGDTDNPIGDDWREAVFSLCSAFMVHSVHSRSNENVIGPTLIQTYATGLKITSGKALRVHLRILDFMKNFYHFFKEGLATLSANHIFEATCDLLNALTQSALELFRNGQGISKEYKTKVTDYQIPYMHQQAIRSIIDLVNDIIVHQGGQAERILRNLVDSQSLLAAFRTVLSNIEAFGAHTWSEVVKAIVGFLHNEPTSYTIISEANIISTLLSMVSSSSGPTQPGTKRSVLRASTNEPLAIPAVADAIVNLSQAFGAICLTTAGFDFFKSSGALERFFEIFESPAHVKIVKDANTLALLGSTFDELVRHHPSLKDVVLSNIITMVARVRYICQARAWKIGAGPKLWLTRQPTDSTVAGGEAALTQEIIPRASHEILGEKLLQLPDGTGLDVIGPPFEVGSDIASNAKDLDDDGVSVVDYLRPAVSFLGNFFENQALCLAFMEAGAYDIVLDLATLPLPPAEQTFGGVNAVISQMSSLMHMMAEVKPHLVLPTIVDRAKYACEALQHFSASKPNSSHCFFEQFVRSPGDEADMDVESTNADIQHVADGTKDVKALTTTLILLQILAELFNGHIYSTRNPSNTLFHQVNVADMLADLCRSLGSLSSACYREEIAIQTVMPEQWLRGTRPGDFTTGHDDMDKILQLTDASTTGTEVADVDNVTPKDEESQESLKQDKQLPAYKNAQTLRYLLIEMPNQIMEFFTRLGRSIAAKRRTETFAKQKTALVAEALADAFVIQLQPTFLAAEVPEDDEARKQRFDYLSVALSNVRGSLSDDNPTMGPSLSRQSFVINAFRKKDGMKILTRIGTEFFEQLASCKYSRSVFSANAGLKICLDILDDFTSGKHIVEGNQAAAMRNVDPNRPFYFNSAQLLLELRMEALTLTRLIWDSEYADQASNDVVLKLISILDHVFIGDHEGEAAKASTHYPHIQPHNKRRYTVDAQKLSALKDKGYPEDLAREALYRCNVGHTNGPFPTTAEEYCKSLQDNPRRRRLPIPADETDSTPASGTTGLRSPVSGPFSEPPSVASFLAGEGGINATLAEVVSSLTENDADDMDDDDNDDDDDLDDVTEPPAGTDNTASAMSLRNILNQPLNASESVESSNSPSVPLFSVTTIDAERESIREQLPEKCNNIVNNHPNLTWELRDLMSSASKKLIEDGKTSFWKSSSDLWINSLLSLQPEEEVTEVIGKRISAAAHLIALYVQDNEVFLTAVESLKENFDELLFFLGIPSVTAQAGEEKSAPWVAPILAIFERMLSFDAEPPQVTWNMPLDMEAAQEAKLIYHDALTQDQRKALFGAIIELLPRVGKAKSMALSIVRSLAILTRNREIAGLQGQRGNLQRLFLMVKQLGGVAQGLIQSSFILIVRHIIEDEAILRQIMQSEIKATMNARSSSRQTDLNNFMRDKYHLALRSPEIFTEVANATIKFATYPPHAGNPALVLKNSEPENPEAKDDANIEAEGHGEDASASAPAVSIEEQQHEDTKRLIEVKAPVVEHPDGVIHFLLSELLAYKDVEDKEPIVSKDSGQQATEDKPPALGTLEPLPTTNGMPEFFRQTIQAQEKSKFKTDDHPIFMYRCFILQTLTELLYSYNRTKIEFINFSRKSDPMAATPSKPRSGVLNYILNALACSGYVDKDSTVACRKKMLTSEWAVKVVVALCTKTGEAGLDGISQRYTAHSQINDQDSEPDLAFVRRFTLEHIIKAFKDAAVSTEPLQYKYSRLLCLADLFNKLLTKPVGPEGFAGLHNNSYKVTGRMMFEKNLIAVLTSSLADIDLSFPSAKKVIKFILRPLQELTSLAVQLSLHSPDAITSAIGNDTADTISSASSVSEFDDQREATPDLFRNSALGIVSGEQQHESDTSDDDEDEDEEMYDDYDGEEMDYDDGVTGPNDGEVVSDDEIEEDIEEDMEGVGPMEGLPGDHPMDIEFVVNDDELSLEGDSDDDESESSDDDDEDLGEDFEMGDDDDPGSDEDQEHESLDDGADGEDGWEDDDEDEDDDGEDADEGDDDAGIGLNAPFGGELPVPIDINIPHNAHEILENLMNGNGSLDRHTDGLLNSGIPQMILQSADREDPVDVDDEDDDDDDGEDGNEDEGMEYDDGFNAMLGGPDDLDAEGQWGWDEPPPAMRRRHGHHAGFSRSGLPFPMHRRYPNLDSGGYLLGGRHHRHAPPARSGAEDGTNPLLQRPNSSRGSRANMPFNVTVMADPAAGMGGPRGNMISMHIPVGQNMPGLPGEDSSFDNMLGHGSVLDAMLNMFGVAPRYGGSAIPPEGLRFSLSGPNDIREMLRSVRNSSNQSHQRPLREETNRIPLFVPLTTAARWQEETRNLFGNTYVDKIQLVQKHLMALLVPLAQEEEKVRRAKKSEEDERRKKEHELFTKQREEQERAQILQAQQAAARAVEEARVAGLAAAIRSGGESDPAASSDVDAMEGVQTDAAQTETQPSGAATTTTEPQRVYTTIRGRQLDITGLDIDLEYLEAIPEELREEVIMTQYTSRRGEAATQENAGTTNDADGIDQDFLNALPEEIREEIRQQELHMARRRERDLARQQRPAGIAQAEDMDNDSFLATLEPGLRRTILAEQSLEVLSTLDSRHAAEGRAHHRGIFYRRPGDRDLRDDRTRREGGQKEKRQVVQLIDRAGVATLLRLMFLPQQGSLRQHLWQILGNVCGNRQTRYELINLLLQILKEGSTDVGAVERSLATLNIRAKASASQKTPQPLKRTLSLPPSAGLSEDMTPMIVVQQCLASLEALCKLGFHIKTIFLREQENGTAKVGKKGKGKENKAAKYPINDLLSLLDRRLILDSSASLSALSTILDDVTSPLKLLILKEKELLKEAAETAKKAAESTQATDSATPQAVGQDDPMTEASASELAASEASVAAASEAQSQAPEQASTTANDEANKDNDSKKRQPFEPPVISEHNLRLITSIFIAPECNADTFGKTLATLSSLSYIPGTSTIFSKELINHVSVLSHAISADLDELLPLIREAQSTTDLQGVTAGKFSVSSSDQVKLLRVLTALDRFTAPKKDEDADSKAKSVLNDTYESLSLGTLWHKLSSCLTAVREKGDTIGFANILLPLIESLMVVCKNTPLKDAPVAAESQDAVVRTPVLSSTNDLEDLFFNFTTEHRKILNDVVRQNPKLMQGDGSFALLVKNSKVLDFDNKRNFFTKQIHARNHQRSHVQPPLQLSVRRSNVFLESYKGLYYKSAEEMKHGKLNIRFVGEEGVDAGGVTREWFQVLARSMFDPNYALFQPVASDRTTFHPSPLSGVNEEHLQYFKFIGRIIGKALHEGRVLDCHFSRAVYKRILGKSPNLKDLESNDIDYYKSLVWILENDITDILTEEFCVIESEFGEQRTVDLIPDGRNIPVTQENKREYVQKLVEYRLTESVRDQLDAFLMGFHDIIPAELVAIFNEQELELLISGLPEVDVDDWKANTEYHNYSPASPQIVWFWRIVRGMTNEERAKLLQFITGTSKVPLNGFKELEGVSGLTKFNIHKDPSTNRLPSSHTCFNQLDLPMYESFELMKQQLMTAINLGADYFGFA